MTYTYRKATALLAATTLTALLTGLLTASNAHGADVGLDGSGECTFPMKKQIEGIPWSLQRVLLDELWQDTKGKGVRVAVIDTGVDDVNPQLKTAVDAKAGKDYLKPDKDNPGAGDDERGKTDGTVDEVGHGTKVAGIIAARPRAGTGFVGLAPEATIIPIRQNDEKNSGKSDTMALAIDHAVARGADVINISQDTTQPLSPDSAMGKAVARALAQDIVVVASAGNDGMDGKLKNTYPAAFPGVLAVASSDRNNERAEFSQSGEFVGVAAPGIDMVSTVPGGGQCVDNGTSFSAPYVSGVAALLKAKHPKWTPAQIVARIEQTAVRSVNGRDNHVGWGVVDPVRALSDAPEPAPTEPTPDPAPPKPAAPEPAHLALTETSQERAERIGTYALGIGVVLVAVVAGVATVIRDSRRRGRGRGVAG
ncbi:type VII secretion-associated serine protease mycosin [Streptomyces sp. P9(2023)]|uniref:type VII secretion-associated serine protease mycosin n=1 Tax=Streptomyces sp. P9(2023) TaxID=3064394 RepID=UPI0028F450AE|nr:type VII secretion-associated serine protease mycosin [Streptomyces sp. P9(2023)]MDT9693416.1 type VII secretion-associated serine protease mycosin [Streptomyces sp. P9(2023)]